MSGDVPLFQPLTLRGLTLPNRVGVAPMCQYSAVDGVPQDWHLLHYGSLVAGGPGHLVIEATGVEAAGRISPGCLGLYTDAAEEGFARLLAALRKVLPVALGVQLAHAGRKASAQRPWQGEGSAPLDGEGWRTFAPSAVAFAGMREPQPMTRADMERVRDAFAAAARRAHGAGFDMIELHSAHGYLLHQFLSPLSNRRTDDFGGSLENRMRFPLEVVAAVREAWPGDRPLGMRISATDWVEGGWNADEAVVYAARARAMGVDYVCCSTGGLVADAKIPAGPAFQVPYAERIRAEAGVATRAVGLIVDPRAANDVVASGKADLVALGRGFLDNPHWVWHAAEVLGVDIPYPPQYERARPRKWPGARLRAVAAE